MSLLDELRESASFLSALDFLPGLLRAELHDAVDVRTRIQEEKLKDTQPTVLLVERTPGGGWSPDGGAVDVIDLEFHCFASGLDASSVAFYLGMSVNRAMHRIARRKTIIEDGINITGFRTWERPRRKTDWADAVGPVQYQDLPQGTERFLLTGRIGVHYRVKGDF